MLTVGDILGFHDLDLGLAGGAGGLDREVRWLHVSELCDPTPFLEGGEFLLTTGLAVGELASAQREYVRRLAGHGLAGLGFGVGLGFAEVPRALVAEAERIGFPVLSVPYEVPFVAITKAAFSHLANEQLERQTRALEVHGRLADAVLEGRGLHALLSILCGHLSCSLALLDEAGRVVAESHSGPRQSFEGAVEVPVIAGDERAILLAARAEPLGDYDRLVLHHGQTALAFELSRRRAISSAELRLAGDLLDDLEQNRLDDAEASRRMVAFGLEPSGTYAALLATSSNGGTGEEIRRNVAEELDGRSARYVSTARLDRAAFLVEIESENHALSLRKELAASQDGQGRLSVGRPAQGRALGHSLLEAQAALDAGVTSYRELGALELLLTLPDPALEAFVDRVLGPAAANAALTDSLTALLEAGHRWSVAAERLHVHRHTLRYRMDRLRDLTGLHPDEPEQRMELWLAVKASQALAARRHGAVPA